LANISYRTGRKLSFDTGREKFVGDAEANAMLTANIAHPPLFPSKCSDHLAFRGARRAGFKVQPCNRASSSSSGAAKPGG
jgi:hypothetical protein